MERIRLTLSFEHMHCTCHVTVGFLVCLFGLFFGFVCVCVLRFGCFWCLVLFLFVLLFGADV